MIEPTNGAASDGFTASVVGNGTANALGREEFMNLLVAQLKHQDPLNPQDGAEFTAQLAQFSSLEQLISVNGKLSGLQSGQGLANEFMALGYIGKQVTALGNTVGIDQSKADPISYELFGDARTVLIDVFDTSGRLVRNMELNDQQKGVQQIAFDGLDNNGSPLIDGQYDFSVVAEDANQGDVFVTPIVQGLVTGLTQRNGSSVLLVGNAEVAIGDVQSVRLEQTPTE